MQTTGFPNQYPKTPPSLQSYNQQAEHTLTHKTRDGSGSGGGEGSGSNGNGENGGGEGGGGEDGGGEGLIDEAARLENLTEARHMPQKFPGATRRVHFANV